MTSPDVVEAMRVPQFHFNRFGNYVACNQYWSVGLDCPYHDRDELKRQRESGEK